MLFALPFKYTLISIFIFTIIIICTMIFEIRSTRHFLFKNISRFENLLQTNRRLVWVILFILLFLLGLPFAHSLPINPHHEGSILYPSYLVNDGYKPLQDVMIQHPPLIAYVYGLGFKLFGEYLIISRYITLFITSIIFLLIARIAAYFLPLQASILLSLFNYLSSGLLYRYLARPWSSTWSLLFIIVSVFILINWVLKRKQYLLFLSGICLGLSIYFRINYGILVSILIFPTTVYISFKDIKLSGIRRLIISFYNIKLLFISTFAVLIILTLLFVKIYGSLEPFKFLIAFSKSTLSVKESFEGASLYQCLGINILGLFASLFYIVFYLYLFKNLNFSKRKSYFSFIIAFITLSLFFYRYIYFNLGFIIVGYSIIDYNKKSKISSNNHRNIYLLLIAMSLGMWLGMYPSKGVGIAMVGLSMLTSIYIYKSFSFNFEQFCNNSNILRKYFVSALLIFLLLNPIHIVFTAYKSLQFQSLHSFSDGFYKHMREEEEVIVEYSSLKSFIEEHSTIDDKILIWKIMSLQYAFLERLPATLPYYDFINVYYQTPMGMDIDTDLYKRLVNSPPKFIISDVSGQNKIMGGVSELALPLTENSFPLIEQFIHSNYSIIWESPLGSYLALKYNY